MTKTIKLIKLCIFAGRFDLFQPENLTSNSFVHPPRGTGLEMPLNPSIHPYIHSFKRVIRKFQRLLNSISIYFVLIEGSFGSWNDFNRWVSFCEWRDINNSKVFLSMLRYKTKSNRTNPAHIPILLALFTFVHSRIFVGYFPPYKDSEIVTGVCSRHNKWE